MKREVSNFRVRQHGKLHTCCCATKLLVNPESQTVHRFLKRFLPHEGLGLSKGTCIRETKKLVSKEKHSKVKFIIFLTRQKNDKNFLARHYRRQHTCCRDNKTCTIHPKFKRRRMRRHHPLFEVTLSTVFSKARIEFSNVGNPCTVVLTRITMKPLSKGKISSFQTPRNILKQYFS